MADSCGTERMRRLLAELGNPEKDLRAIHIAGTNGKGSTAVMIASILECAGFSAGLFTSPHLEEKRERVQIWDGTHRMIAQEHFDELMDRVRKVGSRIESENMPGASECYGRLHVFEVYTAAAYLYFAEERPDYVVLECGLGGRLDPTNTLEKPLCAVITQIGLDHTAELGNTIYKIAREKAGIIKPGVPVVCQPAELAVQNIIRRTAAEKECEFYDVSADRSLMDLKPGMEGEHQVLNAATAVTAVRAAGIEVSEEAVREGIAGAVNPGRFEVLGTDPYWIIDGAHNPDAMRALLKTFVQFTRKNKIKRSLVIFGCMKDKNSALMIQLLTENLRGCRFWTVSVDHGRAEDPEVLGELFAGRGRSCVCYDSVREAFDDANASDYECILITGSIHLAGAMRKYYCLNT